MKAPIRCAAAVVILVLLSACGTAVVRHQVSIAFNDPTGRLGPPPWTLAVGDDTSIYDGRDVDPGSTAAPNAPYRGTYSLTRGAAIWASTRSSTEQLGLIIPALGSGWWKAVILVLDDGSCRGYARRSAIGYLFPSSTAETLFIRGTARAIDGSGWQFELTIDIPPAPAAPLPKG